MNYAEKRKTGIVHKLPIFTISRQFILKSWNENESRITRKLRQLIG